MNSSLLSSFYGLLAAFTWGSGDYCGGIATKKSNPFSVVIFSHLLSLVLLIFGVNILQEPLPGSYVWFWGGLAGFGGGIGLIFLYRSLAEGKMIIAAPISALVAASIPALLTALTSGLPGNKQIAGFFFAFIAIWLISGVNKIDFSINEIKLPVFAGISFGLFFIFLSKASSTAVLYPLIAVRVFSISSLLIFSLISSKKSLLPNKDSIFPLIISGIMDTIGNGAFAISSQIGRLDIASILGSLYPAFTVILAWLFLKETITKIQFLGLLFALLATILISS